MSKSVVFSSCSRISCVGQSSPEVVLCLESGSLLVSGLTTIDGTLTKVYRDQQCGQPLGWRYIVSYDETLLTDPDTPLTAEDITGIFCKGCLTEWVENQIKSLNSAGAFTYVYPSTLPSVGQVLTVQSVSGNVVTLEWA